IVGAQATGGSGSDSLVGIENLTGSSFNDTLSGNTAANVLDGGVGDDRLLGGLGNDVFVFSTALDAASNVDVISGYASGDHLELSGAIFTGLVVGTLDATHFFSGAGLSGSTSAAQGVGIYHDTTTGALYYDADGAGALAGVRFATLAGNPALVAGALVVGP
ncbi:MAG: hypothetical protein RL722_1975, partial [Pseudomonadota bacterium]